MACPQNAEYHEAIQNLRSCVSDEELREGQPALNAAGLPILWAGNFADVYKVHCPATGNTWAVKCFTRESWGLKERYREISAHLNEARLPFMVDFQFVEPGIWAGGGWYPFLKMRWVEGLLLNQFVSEHVENRRTLELLLRTWKRLSQRLREAEIAHCDLEHGNVLLVPAADGRPLSLKLIDYDEMYVPSLKGRRPAELGHPAYQHPQRLREGIYNAEVDRFSQLAIYSAVQCLLVGKGELWSRFDTGENLLFREADFQSPRTSDVFHQLWALNDRDAHAIIGRLILATQMPLDRVPLLTEVVSNENVRPLRRDEEEQVGALLDRGASGVRVFGPFVPAESASPQAGSPAAGRTRGPVAKVGVRLALTAAAVVLLLGIIVSVYVGTRSAPLRIRPIGSETVEAGRSLTVAGSVEDPEHWEEIAVDLGGGLTMDLVLIPPGGFLMGSPDSDPDAESDEKPQHPVRITQPFYLGKYEVTQEQWQAVMGSNPSKFESLKAPVEQVSWDDCQAFLSKLNELYEGTGATFRLPTEAEWEYACRAESRTRWCFGDDQPSLGEYAWYEANSGGSTHPVGRMKANGWGLYDVHGNVWEWCADWYDRGYYRISPSSDPKGPDYGSSRVLRGGSWRVLASSSRAPYRVSSSPDVRNQCNGFRVARAFGDGPSPDLGREAPEPLRITEVPPQTVEAGSLLTVAVSVENAEHWEGKLQYRLGPEAPSGARIDASTGTFTWTAPQQQDPGTHEVAVLVEGPEGQRDGTGFTITVTRARPDPGPEAPEPLRVKPIRPQTVEAGRSLAIAVSVDNAERWEGKLQYRLGPGAPSGATIYAATGMFTWTPTQEQGPGRYEITVLAAGPDGQKTEHSFLVTVTAPEDVAVTLAKQITVDLGGGVTMRLMLIPAGEFLMGSPDSDGDARGEEKPQHPVRIAQPFYLGEYEVTQEQWEAIMGTNPSGSFGAPMNPVEQVSWNDCQAFLSRLNQKHESTGATFSLPTEAQWEYACRAGSRTRWCFGDDATGLEDYAWYGANASETAHPVGQKRANAWGLYDMHGNVWEWCADWYDSGYYRISNYFRTSPPSDPKGPGSGSSRVLRGGSCKSDATYTRSAYRNAGAPDLPFRSHGFRVARTP